MDTDKNLWWYELDGQRMGPVSREKMEQLISAGSLAGDNLVWKEGQETWLPICSAGFDFNIRRDIPPPITGEAVNNRIVWWLAFAPVLGVFAEGVLLEMVYPQPDITDGLDKYVSYFASTDFNRFWFVTIILNIWLCFLDEKYLEKARHDTSKLGSVWLVPAYLYKRAAMLQHNNAYFWVWLVTFLLTILQ